MKNKLTDLSNHLFAQLERLGDEDLKGDALHEELSRAKAVANVAQQIINNGNLALNVIRTKEEYFPDSKALPEFFSDVAPAQLTDGRGKKKIPRSLRIGYES